MSVIPPATLAAPIVAPAVVAAPTGLSEVSHERLSRAARERGQAIRENLLLGAVALTPLVVFLVGRLLAW